MDLDIPRSFYAAGDKLSMWLSTFNDISYAHFSQKLTPEGQKSRVSIPGSKLGSLALAVSYLAKHPTDTSPVSVHLKFKSNAEAVFRKGTQNDSYCFFYKTPDNESDDSSIPPENCIIIQDLQAFKRNVHFLRMAHALDVGAKTAKKRAAEQEPENVSKKEVETEKKKKPKTTKK